MGTTWPVLFGPGCTHFLGVRWQARVPYSSVTQKGARHRFGLRAVAKTEGEAASASRKDDNEDHPDCSNCRDADPARATGEG
jgi:hypothetical protein